MPTTTGPESDEAMSRPAGPSRAPGSGGRAVVLGAGGVVGTAWMAGLAAGLRRDDVDVAEADLIIGTSAGAIVGAMLATGQDRDQLATPPHPAERRREVRRGARRDLAGARRPPGLNGRQRSGTVAGCDDSSGRHTHAEVLGKTRRLGPVLKVDLGLR
jgi:NTE family protein